MSRTYYVVIALLVVVLGLGLVAVKEGRLNFPGGAPNATSTEADAGMRQVYVYFPNSKLTAEGEECTTVFPVMRQVDDVPAIARETMKALLSGPSAAEKSEGYATSINSGVSIRSLSIQDGIASVDFDAAMEKGVGGSCRVASIRKQITETLKQFPSVRTVLISVEGKTDEALQP